MPLNTSGGTPFNPADFILLRPSIAQFILSHVIGLSMKMMTDIFSEIRRVDVAKWYFGWLSNHVVPS